MLPVHTSYPFFEPNQVLSNEHLNQLFAYLDEQERLTRTNLIGIGIVCGLEPTIADDGSQITISKGCGVTSEGYLITWADLGPLRYFKPYVAPENVRYDTFLDDHDGDPTTASVQYPLWMLDRDHNNDPAARPLTLGFLTGQGMPPGEEDEKILILFLECKSLDNKNCSTNSCDDKGQDITATVRPLLIRRRDMDAIQAKVRALGTSATEYLDMAATTSARFQLPELRLQRYDVDATALVNSGDIFDAYQQILSQPLVNSLAEALSAAYMAFQPMLAGNFPSNPFGTLGITLKSNWAYLHNGGIVSQGRYLWYQYYYDFLSDIIQAYNEFRERGMEVLGLCCPDSRLFPRHLMLGKAQPNAVDAAYRHHFMPSPLFSRLHGAFQELLILFQRLVELTNGPELPPQVGATDPTGGNQGLVPVRITPSKLGPFPLSHKAIPYYYRPTPLYQYWDYFKNKQGKERQNLGYRAPVWNFADDFVLNPLRYDLEPNNFLRIEGHLGQSYIRVIQDLIEQKNRERLPIEVIALKTGRNSSNITLPNDLEGCHFQDLEALYDALREQLRCNLCESVMYFYDLKVETIGTNNPTPTKHVPQLAFLQQCAPNFRYTSGTIGALYEANLSLLNTFPYPDLNQLSEFPVGGAFSLLLALFQGGVNTNSLPLLIFIYYQVKLQETLPANLDQLNHADFKNKHEDLSALIRQYVIYYRNNINTPNSTLPQYIPNEDLLDHLEQILLFCKLEPITSVYDEYLRRVQRVRDMLLFSIYIRKNPGIQHKAGVPLAGTFIVVYHGDDQSRETTPRTGRFLLRGRVTNGEGALPGVSVMVVGSTIGAATDLNGEFRFFVPHMPVQLRVSMAGAGTVQRLITNENEYITINLQEPGGENPINRFPNLYPGEVIADFFLPYLCCSDCSPVQFVLPQMPPTFTWEQRGCTTPAPLTHVAPATGQIVVTAQGGVAPYQVSTDGGQTWFDLPTTPFAVADQTALLVRDAEQAVSSPRTILLNPPLQVTAAAAEPPCTADGTQHRTILTVTGGLQPYTLTCAEGTVSQIDAPSIYEVLLPTGQGGTVLVGDSTNDCTQNISIKPFTCQPACNLPCGGRTLDCGYLSWLQPPLNDNDPYQNVRLTVTKFEVRGEITNGGPVKERIFNEKELKAMSTILHPSTISIIASPSQYNAVWTNNIGPTNEFIKAKLSDTFPMDAFQIISWQHSPSTMLGNLAVLRIEHFQCHQFEIVVRVNYNDRFGKWIRVTTYTESKTVVQLFDTNNNLLSESSLPPFNCILRDYCNPDKEPVSLCKDPKEFKISIIKQSGLEVHLRVEPTPAASDQVYWEFQAGDPNFASGSTASTKFPTQGSYLVRAVVVTAGGCATSNSTNINISGLTGGTNPGRTRPTEGNILVKKSSKKSVDTEKPAEKKSPKKPK